MFAGPLVSVIIPTFNRSALLAETVRSVLAQTYTNLEVLVVDDGSTDDTAATVQGLGDPRVSYHRQPHAGRPAPGRNLGLRAARGELVAFLDDDDLWEPVMLERAVAALAANPDTLLVAANANYLPARKHPYFRRRRDERPSFEELLHDNPVINSGVVARRELVELIGPLDESPTLKAVEDYDYWVRTLRHRDRSILVLAEPLVRYRVHATAISVQGWPELERLRVVFAKHADRGELVARAIEARRLRIRRAELRDQLRSGELGLSEWLRQEDVPLRRRVRLAAKALVMGRARV
jgi:glycosyltransferase involved in cell wall biosynthesis